METQNTLPLIGDMAPAFQAQSTAWPINFPKDYKGKRVVLFSHPADFTPVCTTEFIGFQKAYEDFKAINTELLWYSVDVTPFLGYTYTSFLSLHPAINL